jgi:hypothetical protein
MISDLASLPKLTVDQFYALHTDVLVPLDIKINVTQYKQEITAYDSLFRVWGNSHLDWPRFGLPLCNLTGNLDDQVDPSCWPLDKWWKQHPDQLYWDHDFNKLTEAAFIESLSPLRPLHPYMIRSNLLKWNSTGQFVPHVDMVEDTITHIRLWGTTEPSENYELKFNGKVVKNYEPGRLYLINTLVTHSALSLVDNAHTFFITLTLDSLPAILDLCVEPGSLPPVQLV